VRRPLRRLAFGAAGAVALVAALGAGYEAAGRRWAARAFPPPGRLVDVGGRRIQLDCRGAGAPTVVFEAGLDPSGSLGWSAVHDSVAKGTRACAYSRAGVMWSDARPGPHSARAVAEDLHAALRNAGERPPFVLVGHSLGGPYAMAYTKYFGDEVAGLVFVDASHPDQLRRLASVAPPGPSRTERVYKLLAALAWTGVVRAAAAVYPAAPNEPPLAALAMAAYASTSIHAVLAESDGVARTLAEAGTFRRLGRRPLFVLTATAPLPPGPLTRAKPTEAQERRRQEIWNALQADEASWSSRSQHRLVPGAGHFVHLDRPDVVIAAVRAVVDSTR
jgi:pimeloyl-ACP methyl ester carboxylesterase